MSNNFDKEQIKLKLKYTEIMDFIIYLCIFSSIVGLIYNFLNNSYGWDLEGFMYFGNRLLNGEIVFEKEFDDKFLPLHVLFIIPAFLKSHKVWILFSLLITLFTSNILYESIRIYLNHFDQNKNRSLIKKFSIMIGFIHCFIILASPESLLHINLISSELILISFCLLININKFTHKNLLMIILSGFLCSFAISIRPYYLLPALLIGIWLNFNIPPKKEKINNSSFNVRKIISLPLIWICIIFLSLFILNIFPYILFDLKENLYEGFLLNSIEYRDFNPLRILTLQVNYFNDYLLLITLVILNFVFPIFFLSKKIRRYKTDNYLFKIKKDIFFFGLIFPILLTFSFIKRHFFIHYNVLYVPFISICTPLSLYLFLKYAKSEKKWLNGKNFLITIIIICYFIISPTSNFYKPLYLEVKAIFQKQVPERLTEAREVLNLVSEKEGRKSFLVTRNNFIHWYLNESRHGFPPAPVLKKISSKEINLENKKDQKNNFLFPNKDNLCQTFFEYGPDIIFVWPKSNEEKCFLNKDSNYKKIDGIFAKHHAFLKEGN